MSGGRGGVSGKHGRSHDGSRPSRETAGEVWLVPGGDGGGSRDADPAADRQTQAASRFWLDHGTNEPGASPIGGPRGFATVVPGPEESGREPFAGLSWRTGLPLAEPPAHKRAA